MKLETDKRENIHFSKKYPDWETPMDLIIKLESIHGEFDLDPAATSYNKKAKTFFTKKKMD